MSIAGKRAGLSGSRSNLFYEATRIIKEMREETNGEYPKYAVFENVTGAFSSNKGEDFRRVLEEFCKIKMPEAHVPSVKKWLDAGLILGGDFSVAWRVLDAQGWTVPQRRQRIYLVADFTDERAGKVLFESESLCGYHPPSSRAWQGTARDTAEGTGTAGGNDSSRDEPDRGNDADGVAHNSGMTAGGNQVASTLYAAYGTKWNGNAGALNGDNFVAERGSAAEQSGTAAEQSDVVEKPRVVLNDQGGGCIDIGENITGTLRAQAHGHPPCVMDDAASGNPKACGFCTEHSAKARSIGYEEEKSPTLRAGVVPAAMQMYENHSQDARYRGPLETAPTINATYGMGGNNQPFVVNRPFVLKQQGEVPPITLKIRSGCEGGGKGALQQINKSATLGCNNDQTLFVPETKPTELQSCAWDGGQISGTLTKQNAGGNQRMPDKDNFNCVLEPVSKVRTEQTAFGISAFSSNAMLSDNPHAGIYEAKTSRTLDLNGGSPTCNQGGIAIVEKEAVPFACNQRDEVRTLGDKSGALAAEPGMKQQTFVMEQGKMDNEDELTAFHVNQRDEVINLHGKSGALMATQNNQMQTFVLQGSMIGRADKNGPQGSGVNEDVSFSLTSADRHAVCAPENDNGVYAMTTGSYMETVHEKSPPLMARDYKDPTAVAPVEEPAPCYGIDRATFNAGTNAKFGYSVEEELSPTLVAKGPCAVTRPEPIYTVRRLTPTECARLQGFPDKWAQDLGTENPTDEEIAFWTEVWETHRKVVSHNVKPKTEKQIRKWLADPYSDSAAYKMWGNGICLNCALFVLSAIVWVEGLEQSAAE